MSDEKLAYLVFDRCPIRARRDDCYVDATAMCKATGKRWGNYWQNKETQSFILALAESTGIPVDSMVVIKSGRGGGTYVHPRVAIDLARWCSPRFAAVANGWVLDLVTTGKASVRPEPEPLPASPAGNHKEMMDLMTAIAAGIGTIIDAQRGQPAITPPPAPAKNEDREYFGQRAVAAAIRQELITDPARTNGVIVSALQAEYSMNANISTVARHREEMEATREIEPTPMRKDKNGQFIRVRYDKSKLPFHTDIDE